MFSVDEHAQAGTLLQEASLKVEEARTMIAGTYGEKKPYVNILGTTMEKLTSVREKMEGVAIGEARLAGDTPTKAMTCYFGD